MEKRIKGGKKQKNPKAFYFHACKILILIQSSVKAKGTGYFRLLGE